jgi:hypothetical protein
LPTKRDGQQACSPARNEVFAISFGGAERETERRRETNRGFLARLL